MTMGEKILNMRKARGWSQEELADRVGVTRQAVSRWESGSAKPDADKILAVCDLFGVSADYLLREQYGGEPVGQVRQERQGTALGELFRQMTLKQWAGLGIFALGGGIIAVLYLIFLLSETNYVYYSYLMDRYLHGFRAFLRCEEVLGVWCAGLAALVAGINLMLWHRIKDKKWNILGVIHNQWLEYKGITPEE